MNDTNKSVMMVLLMVMSSLLAGYSPAIGDAEAAQVVITDAVQVVDGGQVNDRMAAVDSDAAGNIHIVWSRNTQHLYYTMLDARAQTVISATQISNTGAHRAWNPDIEVDDSGMVHVVWTNTAGQQSIMYTLLDPSFHPQDGSPGDDSTISMVDDFIVSQRNQDRGWPALALDSLGSVHIVWQDSYEQLDKFYQQPQIYYSMLDVDLSTREAITAIDDTLLTPIIGHKGHPDIAVDANDFVQIVWDDTRGGKVEFAAPIDTSGSMYQEWGDMCTVFYGGQWSSGGYFRGIKPMLLDANISVYETLYLLSGNTPSAASGGACATAYATGGSGGNVRPTALGLNPSDHSGGIRKLTEVVYGGAATNLPSDGGYYSEFWGPGSTWACLSWKDAGGNVPGNPPTQRDHKWNPNATKIVMPISDEGPYGGHPIDQQDSQSINEAHDACVIAGVTPVPLYSGNSGGVASAGIDMAKCPNGQTSTGPRICPGSTIRNTNAGGQAHAFPSGGSNSMNLLVEAMIYLATNNSREIYLTVLDPHSLIDNPPNSWGYGDPGHSVSGNSYIESIGPSVDSNGIGSLVVVNDTRITIDDAFSLHPSIAIDSSGNTHLAWMDGRGYGFDKDDNYEVWYTRLRLRGSSDWNGVPGGLPSYGIKQIYDYPISEFEGKNNVPPSRPWGPSSYMPSILADSQDNIHIAWLENSNATAGEEVMYTRLNHTNDAYPDGIPLNSLATFILDEWEPTPVTRWASDKLGPNSGRAPELGQPPAFANDLGSGAHMAWSDTSKCDGSSNNNMYTICYTHILTGQVDVFLENGEADWLHIIEPGEETIFNMTINNTTPGPVDLVADTYSVNLSMMCIVPREIAEAHSISQQCNSGNWTMTMFFASNHTAIFPDTDIYLKGGEAERIYLRVRAPSVYQAHHDENSYVTVSAVSHKDPAIRSDRLTLTMMDVVHGIQLDTSHERSDVEQGQTAIFSITITNTGNVFDSFAFYDPNTIEGQQEWLLPFGWQIRFPLQVSLDPSQSVTKNLEISVPTTQEPGTFALFLKGWSMGEPRKSVASGSMDVLELYVNVSIRSTGNIVFEIYDTTEYVLPGDCASYDIDVIKHFQSGYLIFTTPGAPGVRPTEIPEHVWREDHWTLTLDFANAPGGNSVGLNEPRHWGTIDYPYTVTAVVCAPDNANAGLGPALTVKAHLVGASRVSDSVILSTNVIHVYDLESSVVDMAPPYEYTVDPSDELEILIITTNNGNGADRYDMRVARVTDLASGVEVLWDVDVPRGILSELQRGGSENITVSVNVPLMVTAGNYEIVLDVFSEESYPDSAGRPTRLRDSITLSIAVNEFHDMQLLLDPFVESDIKTTAPGRTVRFNLNVTNNGNVPDRATLHNHTIDLSSGMWNERPGMSHLEKWQISWAIMDGQFEIPCRQLGVGDEAPANECVRHADGTWILPEMASYSTIPIVALVNISTEAALGNQQLGLKVRSFFGNMMQDGDTDDSESWEGELLDTNELIVTIRLRAPNLRFEDVSGGGESGDVGDMLAIRVKIINDGNVHATDIHVIVCQDQSKDDVRKNGCDEENVAYRQVIGALMPPDAADHNDPAEIVLLYPVKAGNHDIVLVIDPDNMIVESSERDNIFELEGGLKSSNGWIDQATETLGAWGVPGIIILLTLSLMAVAGLVMYGRRKEALAKVAEQSSLLSTDEMF
ncbi:MAG TPA: hypothetical protein EYQ78_03125 [Candidatus Poseidoniales archaeon]|jgi:hypothetical protein|nr:hypothetical protein [Candidatus Poseidoniales archaeon]